MALVTSFIFPLTPLTAEKAEILTFQIPRSKYKNPPKKVLVIDDCLWIFAWDL
jgi:hypothetical protein